jgi:sodium pump decarboxylase gamma subunit
MSPLVASLWITLIGMGLVFIAILLLWGLMEGLMSLTARFAAKEAEEEAAEGEETEQPEALPMPTSDQKKRAAAAAVAVAMALRRPATRPNLPAASGSGWQAVTRASQLNQPTHITRKSRGSVR